MMTAFPGTAAVLPEVRRMRRGAPFETFVGSIPPKAIPISMRPAHLEEPVADEIGASRDRARRVAECVCRSASAGCARIDERGGPPIEQIADRRAGLGVAAQIAGQVIPEERGGEPARGVGEE